MLLGLDLVKDWRTKTPDPELAQRVAGNAGAGDDDQRCEGASAYSASRRRLRLSPPNRPGLEIFDTALAAPCTDSGFPVAGAVFRFETRLYLLYPLRFPANALGVQWMIKKLSQAAIVMTGILALGGCTLFEQGSSAAAPATSLPPPTTSGVPPSPPATNILASATTPPTWPSIAPAWCKWS